MAKAPEQGRAPVTARGVELLKLIAAAPNGVLMLTQAEGKDIVDAGQAVVDGNNVSGDTAGVSLTPAGLAAVAAAPKIAIRSDLAVPAKTRKPKAVKYPIDQLEVGQSFHIPLTADNTDPAASIQSTISGARAKYAEPLFDADGKPIMETVHTREYEKGPDGKAVKDANGKRIVKTGNTVERQKTKIVRDFVVATVGANDPDGPGARVWRSQ